MAGERAECAVCPASVARCAHWGPYVVRLYPPSRFDPRVNFWGVEGPGVIDPPRSRREGAPDWAMYLPDHDDRFSARHDEQSHAELDFNARADAMRAYSLEGGAGADSSRGS